MWSYGNKSWKYFILIVCVSLVLLVILYKQQHFTTVSTWYHNSLHNRDNEARHVTFLKIHKTGSSTVQNIFIRFGDHQNLTFMLASLSHNECGNFSNCISFYNTITDTNISPPPQNRKYELLCSHVIYNKERFQKYLPKDTKYISLVREPISRLASAVGHFKLLKGVSFPKYVRNPLKYDHFRLNNAMAYEFGFRKELFPSIDHRHLSAADLEEIGNYTKQLFKDFSIILINERLSESLVLMKRILNWGTKDILFSNKLVKEHRSFSGLDTTKLQTYLTLDYIIYNAATRELQLKIDGAGPGFQDEVEDFREVNKQVRRHCASGDTEHKELTIEPSIWHERFKVTKQFCFDLTLSEIPYLVKIRRKQYGTFDTA